MRSMPRVLIAMALALSVVAIPIDADADSKQPPKPTTEQKLLNCDYNNINCTNDCTNLIDIGTAVADCEKKCERGYRTCKRRAQMFQVLPPSTDSLSSPPLAISPRKGGDDAKDTPDNAPPPDGTLY